MAGSGEGWPKAGLRFHVAVDKAAMIGPVTDLERQVVRLRSAICDLGSPEVEVESQPDRIIDSRRDLLFSTKVAFSRLNR